MGLITRLKDWEDKEILTEADLDAEFDNITDFIVDATTIAKGLVMLEDSHASTSVAKAACPKNVKEAYDLAGTMLTKATFNANTFIYAVTDDTPIVKTRAEVMSLLSGQAAADFAMNTHKITGVVDPTANQDVATKKFTDDTFAVLGANADITSMTALTQITRATGGAFDIAIGSAAGDDFTVDTDKLVVEGDTGKVMITGNVGIGTTTPATSAKLDLTSTTGSLLLTRMTTVQRDALTAVNGMVLYNSTLNKVQVYEGGAWVSVI